ncbi:MAG: hypothetical protein KIS66_02050 [Fimbriimonadaceae bacterium]|nr:hypothetical protein [Fimbriimonadaceae bacterium]
MSKPTSDPVEINLRDTPLALEECVTCGQVFLWTRRPGGRWLGVDGDAWFLVEVLPDRLRIVGDANGQDLGARFRRLFRLDEDLDALRNTILERGPELAPYLGRRPGLRMARPTCPVEATFSFLCTSNNHLARIGGMVRWLQGLGPVIGQFEGEPVRRFPGVDRIADLSEEALREAGFGYRAKTIPLAARAIQERGGEAWLHDLRRASYEEAHACLLDLPGVGPKLADCIALFALHHTEAVPVDTHLWHAAVQVYFPDLRGVAATPQRSRVVGDHLRARFGNLAGWVQHFLFVDTLRERGRGGR